MSEQTNIEWCDSTFNPWLGCTRVSTACDNCYAAVSTPARTLGLTWGPNQERRRTAPSNWKQPVKWNAQAEAFQAKHGRRQRVFCASLADVFDNEIPAEWRADLFELIEATPELDWLLLTKRVGNVETMVPETWLTGEWPANAWLGITAVTQKEVNRDVAKLVELPAPIRFLSMEPLLEGVDILKWLDPFTCADCGFHGSEEDAGADGCNECGEVFGDSQTCQHCGADDQSAKRSCPSCGSHRSFERDHGFKFESGRRLIDWVIVGGESGPGARPMHADWARSLRDQCVNAGVPFLFKQWGEWLPWTQFSGSQVVDPPEQTRFDTMEWCDGAWRDVGKPDIWATKDGDVDDTQCVGRVGKKAAGRVLDGRTWDGFPEAKKKLERVG